MNWAKDIEVEGKEGKKAEVSVGHIQDLLMAYLTKDEIEEFAGELIKWVEFSKPLYLVME
jgi:hypothetical protein